MLFDPHTEESVRESVARLKRDEREALKRDYDLAIDYLEDRQRQDIESELLDRFPSTQIGDTGQEMYPVVVPLVRRYIEESASAYTHTVKRKAVTDDGEETDFTRNVTLILNRHLAKIQYDEFMGRNDQLVHLLKSSSVWYQQDRGLLSPRFVLPQNDYPVLAADAHGINPTNQADYEGHVVELFWSVDDVTKVQKRTFAYVTAADTTFFHGTVGEVQEIISGPHPNPYMWMQVPDSEPGVRPPPPTMLPLQPLTVWHKDYPIDQLLPASDVSIVHANRELNISWSVIMDTLRMQGYDIPVKNLRNPDDPKARQRHGARFPVILGLEESFSYLHSSANYSQMTDALVRFQKLIALSERMSPNDFAVDGQSVSSGFAKVIDSLPKIEAREQRLKRLVHQETEVAWPRIASILIWLGVLPAEASNLRLRVEFSDIDIPQTVDEEVKSHEFDFRYNLSTPAHVYAKEHNVSLDDAKLSLEANRTINDELGAVEQPQPQQQQPGFARLGGRIGLPNARGTT